MGLKCRNTYTQWMELKWIKLTVVSAITLIASIFGFGYIFTQWRMSVDISVGSWHYCIKQKQKQKTNIGSA